MMEQFRKTRTTKSDFEVATFTALILINITFIYYYSVELWKLYIEEYNYDGWRFLIPTFMICSSLIVLALVSLFKRKWKILFLLFVNFMLVCLPLAVDISYMPFVGSILGVLWLCFLICKRTSIIQN